MTRFKSTWVVAILILFAPNQVLPVFAQDTNPSRNQANNNAEQAVQQDDDQRQQDSATLNPLNTASVFATVAGFEIGPGEVRFLLNQLNPASEQQKKIVERMIQRVGSKDLTTEERLLFDSAVEQWIQRLVVLDYLRTKQLAVSAAQVDAEYSRRETSMRERGEDLSEFLKLSGLTAEGFKKHLAWEMSWKSYTSQKVTKETLEKYFEVKHYQFDGTQLRVAHIFKAFPKVSTELEKNEILKEMGRLKQEIESGGCSFKEAASECSEGTTATDGGELGWIDYSGPQSVPFNEAAFATPVGKISVPVRTDNGVHLIRILEKKDATIPFAERIDLVRVAVVSDLWKWILLQQQDQVSVIRNR